MLMSLTVVGSIAFDTVKTPFGERERMLGGTAVHFSLAASFFTEVRPVGPVGDDFGDEQFEVLERRGVITDDIERVAGGSTFFWRGHYEFDLNVAHTDDTQLDVFAEFEPKLSEASQAADMLFLANIQPDLQRRVRAQCAAASFSGLDSMNLWIETAKDSLLAAIAEVDCLVVNDAEIRQLTGESNLARAARAVMDRGRARSSPSRASTARRCSPRTASSPCPASRSRTCATRPAPATASPAASSATSTATAASSTTATCGGRWATAPCWPPSTSRSSAPSESPGSAARRSTSGWRRCTG